MFRLTSPIVHGWRSALLTVALTAFATRVPAVDVSPRPLEVGHAERLLVVAPHPDDETIGAGGLIQRVLARGGSVRIVLVTAGDGYIEAVVHETGKLQPPPTQYIEYGQRRLREARAAVRVLDGGDHLRMQFLGFPDGGLQGLLRAHWWRTRPERSSTTDATDPPYDEAVEPDVPYDGADLRRELDNIFRETRPTIVALPHPRDKHPDHRATGLFTLLALHDYLTATHAARPRLLAYLVHWPDWPPGWNASSPSEVPSDAPLALPPNLPRHPRARVSLNLSPQESETKRAALAKYGSQQQVMASFLAAFVRRTEPFITLSPAELYQIGHWIERGAPRTPKK